MTTRRKLYRSALLAATMLAASCASVGVEEALAPVALPTDWAAVSGAFAAAAAVPVTENWLQELSDPTVEPLVAEAIAYNNNLAAAAARVRASRERARVVRADMLPQLSASAVAVRNRPSGIGGVQGGQFVPGGSYINFFSTGLDLSWELDVWGRLTDQTRAAYLNAEAERLDYAAAALSLAGSTAQRFYALTEARLQRQLAERDVETGEANLAIIERRYERGISSALDVRLARSSLASSQAQLIARQQEEKEAARLLEVLLGRYPAASVNAADGLPDLRPLVSEDGGVIGVGAPENLLFRRPDVLVAERRLQAAGLEVSAARKALLPSISLSAVLTGETVDPAGDAVPQLEPDFSQLIDPDALGKRLVGQLVQPIFQGGRLRANIKAERAELEAAVYDYAEVALTAFREVEDAIAAERFLAQQQAARRAAFDEAVAAEELTERQYLSGTTDIFDLISAQQRRINNESQFIGAARARLTNRIDLYLALGAPFTVDPFEREGGARFTPALEDPALDGSAMRRSKRS